MFLPSSKYLYRALYGVALQQGNIPLTERRLPSSGRRKLGETPGRGAPGPGPRSGQWLMNALLPGASGL